MINVLISRPYINQDNINTLKFFSRSIDIRLLIDCGAYTDYMAGKAPMSIQAYIEWIQTNLPLFESIGEVYGYFALDVIGDRAATMRNYEAMLEAGLKPVPILTRGVDQRDIDRMVDTAPYIALGGIFGTTAKERSALRYMIDSLPDGYPAHWLGFTQPSFVRHYQPTSFDSSNWCRAAKWGFINIYNGDLQWGRTIRYGDILTPQDARIIRSRGFDPALLRDKKVWRTYDGLNLTSCINNSMYLKYQEDLGQIGVKLFFALGTRWGLDFSLLNRYTKNGEECIGLPGNRMLRKLLESYQKPEDITQQAVGIACRHY